MCEVQWAAMSAFTADQATSDRTTCPPRATLHNSCVFSSVSPLYVITLMGHRGPSSSEHVTCRALKAGAGSSPP
jgi:hypothetical protein